MLCHIAPLDHRLIETTSDQSSLACRANVLTELISLTADEAARY